jgi:hypothetical protein
VDRPEHRALTADYGNDGIEGLTDRRELGTLKVTSARLKINETTTGYLLYLEGNAISDGGFEIAVWAVHRD